MTGTNAQSEITAFHRSIEACADPAEISRKVKLAFKRMPGEMALACFAKVITAEMPHQIKVAVWDAVRYSHIWWGVDEVLKGPVMENPTVQQAFADAVPMRKWMVDHACAGWEYVCMTLRGEYMLHREFAELNTANAKMKPYMLIMLITLFADEAAAQAISEHFSAEADAAFVRSYRDGRGNNILWYLTYRDDQNAQGGFACPCIERELLRLGADPNLRNNLGLCWNDVRHRLNRLDKT